MLQLFANIITMCGRRTSCYLTRVFLLVDDWECILCRLSFGLGHSALHLGSLCADHLVSLALGLWHGFLQLRHGLPFHLIHSFFWKKEHSAFKCPGHSNRNPANSSERITDVMFGSQTRSWSLPNTAHFACLLCLTHPFQVLELLLMSSLVESGVINKGDMQNMQCWECSRN